MLYDPDVTVFLRRETWTYRENHRPDLQEGQP